MPPRGRKRATASQPNTPAGETPRGSGPQTRGRVLALQTNIQGEPPDDPGGGFQPIPGETGDASASNQNVPESTNTGAGPSNLLALAGATTRQLADDSALGAVGGAPRWALTTGAPRGAQPFNRNPQGNIGYDRGRSRSRSGPFTARVSSDFFTAPPSRQTQYPMGQ